MAAGALALDKKIEEAGRVLSIDADRGLAVAVGSCDIDRRAGDRVVTLDEPDVGDECEVDCTHSRCGEPVGDMFLGISHVTAPPSRLPVHRNRG